MKTPRWVGWLLLIYPAEFRDQHRVEVEDFVGSALEGRGRWRAWTLLTVAIDLVGAGVRLRLRPVGWRVPGTSRRGRGVGWFRGTTDDARLASRGLLRNPGFTVIVVLTLALGVGLNAALFSVVNAVLLRPLEYDEPDRLAYLTASHPVLEISDAEMSGGDLLDLRQVAAFETVEGVAVIRQNLHGAGLPRQVEVGWVSGGFLEMFGVAPELGRLHREDDPPGMVVLSHRLWTGAFNQDPDVLGRSIELDGYPFTVIGVAAAHFTLHLPARGDPLPDIELWKNPDGFWQNGNIWSAQGPEFSLIRAVGRLRSDVSFADAQAGVDVVVADLRDRFPALAADGFEISVDGLQERVVEGVRPTLRLLLGAVGLVLLIACANVANLLLVRGHARRRETALRLALGSPRGRVGRYLMVESLMLALAGTGAGVLLAQWAITVIPSFAPPELALVRLARIDSTVMGYVVGAALLVTLLVGTLPALAVVRTDPSRELGNGRSGGGRGAAFRNGLVVGQVALSIVLLVGAGLLTSSVVRLHRVDPGFDPADLYTFGVSIPGSQYGWPKEANDFYREVESRVAALPGVESAGVVWPMPFSEGWSGEHRIMEGDAVPLGMVAYRLATESYFPTVGVPLLDGRLFREGDSTHVLVISGAVADRTWPGRAAVGRSLQADPWGRGMEDFEVIGVVGDVRARSLRDDPQGTLYFDARAWSWVDWEVHVLARSSMAEATLLPALRATVAAVDESVPLAHPGKLIDAIAAQTAAARFVVGLLGIFAAVAVALSLVGLYGVISYAVGLRSREFGVRMALGSASWGIRRMVLTQGGMLALCGVTPGLMGAWALSGVLEALLFEVAPTDPATYGVVAVLVVVGAGVASWIPAWRVSRVDPVEVLRAD